MNEGNFKFYLLLINLNLSRHMSLVASKMEPPVFKREFLQLLMNPQNIKWQAENNWGDEVCLNNVWSLAHMLNLNKRKHENEKVESL